MPKKKAIASVEPITHHSQLKKAAVYMANGRLARYTGRQKRCAPLFTLRPVFSAHGETFTAKINTVQRIAKEGGRWEGVRAYLGRHHNERLGGVNERVRAALMVAPLPTRQQPRNYLLRLFARWRNGD